MKYLSHFFLLIYLITFSGAPLADDDYPNQRLRMIQSIENDVRATRDYIGMSSLSPGVMKAMGEVKRHEFVPEKQKPYAYENRPLPIGHGQTISQPYIVALMTELMNVTGNSTVLEVGTGSGYQAAVLGSLVNKVYTIEIIEPLWLQAQKRLQLLGYNNVSTKIGDGYYGWQEHAPFDSIIVTAASGSIPPPLLQQLKPGGNMVIPVGSRFLTQQLLLIKKDENGKITTHQILPVRFVPLTGDH